VAGDVRRCRPDDAYAVFTGAFHAERSPGGRGPRRWTRSVVPGAAAIVAGVLVTGCAGTISGVSTTSRTPITLPSRSPQETPAAAASSPAASSSSSS